MKKYLLNLSLLFLMFSNKIFSSLIWEKYQHLTPENLCHFSKCSNSCELSKKQINILIRIIKNPQKLSSFITQQFLNKKCLQKNKMLEYDSGNYILTNLKNKQEVIKSAGHLNRLRNLSREQSLTQTGDNYKKFGTGSLAADDLDKEIPNTPTYQTSSYMAYFLILKKTIEIFNLRKIKVANTKLIKINNANDINDENIVIIQQKLENIGKTIKEFVKEHPLPEDLIYEFACIIVNAVFWDIESNSYTDGEKIYLFDIEQPNKMKPSEAYFKNTDDIQFNILVGLKEFYEILESGIEKQGNILTTWIKEGPFAKNLKRFKNQKFLKEILK